MTANLIDGTSLALSFKNEMSTLIKAKSNEGAKRPTLAVITVGNYPASVIYMNNIHKACEEIGIIFFSHHLQEDTREDSIIQLLQSLSQDNSVHGILISLPLPSHINTLKIIEHIDHKKDVDGFHPFNLGKLMQNRSLLSPCASLSVMVLLQSIHQSFINKHAVIIGASNTVGIPIALKLLLANATTTICHQYTYNLPYFVKQADILISAVGKPYLVEGSWIKENATVIDVGTFQMPDGSIIGDIEFEAAKKRAAWITPVPGGVGPMTVAMIMHNTLLAAGYLPQSGKVLR